MRQPLAYDTSTHAGDADPPRLRALHHELTERQLLAYALHDGVCQHLAAALMLLDTAAESFDVAASQHAVSQARDILRRGNLELRRLIRGLQPVELESLGLVGAIAELIATANREGAIAVRFEAATCRNDFPPLVSSAIYRVAQESLANIRRHSQATAAWLVLSHDDLQIRLSARDNGRGFHPGQLPAQHLGLRGIRDRAELLGGHARIDSAPGQGTLIEFEIPLSLPGSLPYECERPT